MPDFSVKFSLEDIINQLKVLVEDLVPDSDTSNVEVVLDSGYNDLRSITLKFKDKVYT